MDTRLEKACERLLQAATLAARPGARTYQYFDRAGGWEPKARHGFATLNIGPEFEPDAVRTRCEKLLGDLNRDYKTRHDLVYIPGLNQSLIETVVDLVTEGARGLQLLDSSVAERKSLAEHLVSCIRKANERARIVATNKRSKRPYSLSTKFLHFAMPDTFAIFDDQAAQSIAMWRYFAFACEELATEDEGIQFSWRVTAVDKGGSGYRSILDFYWLLWSSVSDDVRREASRAAQVMQASMRERYPEYPRARFSVLDLVDKLLWKASGNPIILGLVRPPI